MKSIYLGLAAALTMTLVSCSDTATTPFENPEQQNMSFKTGATYTTRATITSPEDGTSTTTERSWTLVNPSATLRGRSNVAVWVDSVVSVGGIITVADSILLQQLPGNNDVYRYALLIPELTVPSILGLDLQESWMHEARLKAQTSTWPVAEIADTIPPSAVNMQDVPGLTGIKIAISDQAQAAGTENITIGSQTFLTTKTVHTIKVSASALTALIPFELLSESLTRTTWTSAELGAIIKEERQGKVISAKTPDGTVYKLFPIPGYSSQVTAIVSRGN